MLWRRNETFFNHIVRHLLGIVLCDVLRNGSLHIFGFCLQAHVLGNGFVFFDDLLGLGCLGQNACRGEETMTPLDKYLGHRRKTAPIKFISANIPAKPDSVYGESVIAKALGSWVELRRFEDSMLLRAIDPIKPKWCGD